MAAAATINDHDFVEIEYTGKLADGTVFDTTRKDVAAAHGLHNSYMASGPVTICVGEHQIVGGLDAALVGRGVGPFSVSLDAAQAFGKKDAKKIRLVPLRVFVKQRLQPHPGLQVTIDGSVATILRVTGGRVLVDFNHPLAGRDVVYDIDVKRFVTDKAEQITGYLKLSLGIAATVRVDGGRAEVTLPIPLPDGLRGHLTTRLASLVQLDQIDITGAAASPPPLPAPDTISDTTLK